MANILILCERSGAIRNALARLGHTVTSVDTLPARGPIHPGAEHVVDDALNWIDGDPRPDSPRHGQGWDLCIARPPCTYLSNSGVRWLFEVDKKTGLLTDRAKKRWVELAAAIKFFNAMKTVNAPFIAIENPVPHKHARLGFQRSDVASDEGIGDATQYVQPWDFGHPESKKTGWWLRGGLPRLRGTDDVRLMAMALPAAERNRVHYASPGEDRWEKRSLLVEGMAEAIADQWGGFAERRTTA